MGDLDVDLGWASKIVHYIGGLDWKKEVRELAEQLRFRLENGLRKGEQVAVNGSLVAKLSTFADENFERRTPQTLLQRIFRCLQECNDPLVLYLLVDCLRRFLGSSKTDTAYRKRLLRLVKMDCVRSLIRALQTLLTSKRTVSPPPVDEEEGEYRLNAIRESCSLMMTLSTRDGKFSLKFRLSGMLQQLATVVCAVDDSSTPDAARLALVTLLAHVSKSSRNALYLGRYKDFTLKLLKSLLAVANKSDCPTELAVAYSEAFYFVIRNRKNKARLVEGGAVELLVRQLVSFLLEENGDDSREKNGDVVGGNWELALRLLASVRQLARFKSGRLRLVAAGGLEVCEKAIRKINSKLPTTTAAPRPTVSGEPSATGGGIGMATSTEEEDIRLKLLTSLSALCMRCLPTEDLPISNGSFPLRQPLPLLSLTNKNNLDEEDGRESDEDEAADDVAADFETKGHNLAESDDETDSGVVLAVQQKRQPLTNSKYYEKFFSEYDVGGQPTAKNEWTSSKRMHNLNSLYRETARTTNSLIPRVKIAYPEWVGAYPDLPMQPFAHFPYAFSEKVAAEVSRHRNDEKFQSRVVYDLDELIKESDKATLGSSELTNDDIDRCGVANSSSSSPSSADDHLYFESRFESGNLRRATLVGRRRYQLCLTPDINQSRGHFQWFYFQVSNNEAGLPYHFEIVNLIKSTSMFASGMQPLLMSVTEAKFGREGWVRAGQSICYYRNRFVESVSASKQRRRRRRTAAGGGGGGGRQRRPAPLPDSVGSGTAEFYSLSFVLTFRHKLDVCYIAYHFPYTYSYLETHLERWALVVRRQTLFRREKLCDSLAGNNVDVLTITERSNGADLNPNRRRIVFLSGRVHPGESNSSWIMHGFLHFALGDSPKAAELRSLVVLKVVPMLNPDGVVNGCSRCSLTGQDLNRQWLEPNLNVHPSIHRTKGLVEFAVETLGVTPFLFCDFHGHSRRCNVFIYANNPEEDWRRQTTKDTSTTTTTTTTTNQVDDKRFFDMAEQLSRVGAPAFALDQCRFHVDKSKESSARVALWRQFALPRCHTVEATYAGFDRGVYAGHQIGTRELRQFGRHFGESLLRLVKSCADDDSS